MATETMELQTDSKTVSWNMQAELGLLTAVLVFFYFVQRVKYLKEKKLPPGPIGLPLMGYIPFLSSEPHVEFHKLSKKYGDVFSINMGGKLVVVVSNPDLLREVYNKPVFNARPKESIINPMNFENTSLIMSGPDWLEQRKFVFHTLRGFGRGMDFIEETLQKELQCLLKVLREANGQPVATYELIMSAISNFITALLTGKRYDYDSEERKLLTHWAIEIARWSDQTAIQGYRRWFATTPGLNKFMKLDHYDPMFKDIRKMITGEVEQHKSTLKTYDLRDFIDAYLVQIQKAQKKNPETSFNDDILIGTLYNLYGAGSENIRKSTDWCFYNIVHNPEVQRKVQAEIDDVIGQDRMPEGRDRKFMPYTMATIMESMRLHPVIETNIVRANLEDTKIGDYEIPKETTIFSNIWAIQRDPRFWDNPQDFVPERFIGEDGIYRPKAWLHFSFGKRVCPGEAVAMIEVFLYVATVLQKFDIRLPDGKPEYREGTEGKVAPPIPDKYCFIPRS